MEDRGEYDVICGWPTSNTHNVHINAYNVKIYIDNLMHIHASTHLNAWMCIHVHVCKNTDVHIISISTDIMCANVHISALYVNQYVHICANDVNINVNISEHYLHIYANMYMKAYTCITFRFT